MSLLALAVFYGTLITNPEPKLLTLDAALEETRRNNWDLHIARERLASASVLSKQAWSLFLPVLSAQYNYTVFNQEVVVPFNGQSIVIQQRTQQDASLNMDWILINGRSIPLFLNAGDQVDAARFNYAEFEAALMNATTIAYYNVLNADRQVKIRKRAFDVAKANFERAQARVEVGEATQLESLRAEAEMASTEQDWIQAQNSQRIIRYALAVILGRATDSGTYSTFEVERPERAERTSGIDLFTLAMKERLDLKQRQLELRIAERSKIETWTKFLPELVATGNYRWNEVAGFQGNQVTWQAGLSARWTFFEGGIDYWELEQRSADIRAAQGELARTRQRIAQQIADARNDLESSVAALNASKRRLRSALRSAELATAQYELGAATQLDVLEANRSAADAAASEALAELAADVARINLRSLVTAPPLQDF